MIPEIVASMSAVRESLNLLKVINEAKNETELRNATFELQRKLQDIQMDNLRLIDLVYESKARITELEKEINNKISFESKVEGYSPYTFESGTFTYINNSAIDGSDAPRYLCASCYEKSIVSILQPCKGTIAFLHSFCPHCKNTYRTNKAPPTKFV
ncbi:hypothetical protein ISO79_03210 [Morganella morganii subsp. morganii]|uniref:Uncharacterized protein n=1 Tax=Morganella morganii TaxID=582 RepID=A0AAE4JSM2_MORMO|nr:hypothetical protein [Morganella morganii]EME8469681.1 hypothetical protein [Morganella morganii]MBT0372744.1 hypothetical protein [Morganella morganii subsp. morganii]MBT0392445.1 hypothetical protein [Morganella morganii subsp. morganii]MCT1586457.1 hypothetical protein [Morganella morganii]MDS0898857.1 hypothetical protein [Morganella morganii]